MWRLIAWIVSRPTVTHWLVRRALRTPYVHIVGSDGSLYMERWWLFNPYDPETKRARWPDWVPSVRIHHIHRPDNDRDQHDHPWNARTIILQGCYEEVRGDTAFCRVPGDTATLKFGEYHRIAYVPPEGAWTLFITGKFRGTWGFLVDGLKVPFREYLARREGRA